MVRFSTALVVIALVAALLWLSVRSLDTTVSDFEPPLGSTSQEFTSRTRADDEDRRVHRQQANVTDDPAFAPSFAVTVEVYSDTLELPVPATVTLGKRTRYCDRSNGRCQFHLSARSNPNERVNIAADGFQSTSVSVGELRLQPVCVVRLAPLRRIDVQVTCENGAHLGVNAQLVVSPPLGLDRRIGNGRSRDQRSFEVLNFPGLPPIRGLEIYARVGRAVSRSAYIESSERFVQLTIPRVNGGTRLSIELRASGDSPPAPRLTLVCPGLLGDAVLAVPLTESEIISLPQGFCELRVAPPWLFDSASIGQVLDAGQAFRLLSRPGSRGRLAVRYRQAPQFDYLITVSDSITGELLEEPAFLLSAESTNGERSRRARGALSAFTVRPGVFGVFVPGFNPAVAFSLQISHPGYQAHSIPSFSRRSIPTGVTAVALDPVSNHWDLSVSKRSRQYYPGRLTIKDLASGAQISEIPSGVRVCPLPVPTPPDLLVLWQGRELTRSIHGFSDLRQRKADLVLPRPGMITVVAANGAANGQILCRCNRGVVSAGVAGQDGFTFSPLPPGKYYILSAGQHFEVSRGVVSLSAQSSVVVSPGQVVVIDGSPFVSSRGLLRGNLAAVGIDPADLFLRPVFSAGDINWRARALRGVVSVDSHGEYRVPAHGEPVRRLLVLVADDMGRPVPIAVHGPRDSITVRCGDIEVLVNIPGADSRSGVASMFTVCVEWSIPGLSPEKVLRTIEVRNGGRATMRGVPVIAKTATLRLGTKFVHRAIEWEAGQQRAKVKFRLE
jgi:hypothetical protein